MELNDLVQLGVLFTVRLSTFVLPENRWRGIGDNVAKYSIMLKPSRLKKGVSKLEHFFPSGLPGDRDAKQLLAAITKRYVEETMIYTRLSQRPDWRPPMSVAGLDLIKAEQGDGKGVVLWLAPQVATHILTRIAVHDAGYRVCHLRNWMHGPSPTWFGRTVLNPLYWRVENRIADHVVIPTQGPAGAVRRMRRLLRDGAIVSLRGLGSSNAPRVLPLFGGKMELATGAPRIALGEDASLVCVHSEHANQGWKLVFSRLRARGEKSDVDSLVQEFSGIVRTTILKCPDLWPVQHRQFIAS